MATAQHEDTKGTSLDLLLAELDELIDQATSGEIEGDAALAIRSIAW